MRIRIAQRAWDGAAGVEKIGPNTIGVDLLWVELDGVRITDVERASVEFSAGCAVPEITVRPFGTVEVVYISPAGEEIGASEADPRSLVGNKYEHEAKLGRPPRGDLDRAVRERDDLLVENTSLRAQLRRLLTESVQ